MEDKRSPHTAQMTIRALAIICAHPHRVEAAHSSLTWWRGVLEAAANRGGAQGGLQRCCDVPERLEQAQVSRGGLRPRHRRVEAWACALLAVQLEGRGCGRRVLEPAGGWRAVELEFALLQSVQERGRGRLRAERRVHKVGDGGAGDGSARGGAREGGDERW